MAEKKVQMQVDIQCGSCGALSHLDEKKPIKFCPGCGAGVERMCLACRRKVDMYFEEWWPEDDVCVRTYMPARRCPTCNADLEGRKEENWKDISH